MPTWLRLGKMVFWSAVWGCAPRGSRDEPLPAGDVLCAAISERDADGYCRGTLDPRDEYRVARDALLEGQVCYQSILRWGDCVDREGVLLRIVRTHPHCSRPESEAACAYLSDTLLAAESYMSGHAEMTAEDEAMMGIPALRNVLDTYCLCSVGSRSEERAQIPAER